MADVSIYFSKDWTQDSRTFQYIPLRRPSDSSNRPFRLLETRQ